MGVSHFAREQWGGNSGFREKSFRPPITVTRATIFRADTWPSDGCGREREFVDGERRGSGTESPVCHAPRNVGLQDLTLMLWRYLDSIRDWRDLCRRHCHGPDLVGPSSLPVGPAHAQ